MWGFMYEKDEEKLEVTTVNISKKNLDWLKKINEDQGRNSISNTLNFMLTNLRERKNKGMIYDG